ncbi:hypothetical protein VTK56DRAFT_6404 [Thermocarpiscus australiensis]
MVPRSGTRKVVVSGPCRGIRACHFVGRGVASTDEQDGRQTRWRSVDSVMAKVDSGRSEGGYLSTLCAVCHSTPWVTADPVTPERYMYPGTGVKMLGPSQPAGFGLRFGHDCLRVSWPRRPPENRRSMRLIPAQYPGNCGIRLLAACLRAFTKALASGHGAPVGEEGCTVLTLSGGNTTLKTYP